MTPIQDFIDTLAITNDTSIISISVNSKSFSINVGDFKTRFNLMSARQEYVNVPELNVRANHTIYSAIVGELPFGTLVNVLPIDTVTQDGHTWQRIEQGWIAGDLTSPTNPVTTRVRTKKFGMNVLGQPVSALVASAERLWRNGTPIGSVTVINDVSIAVALLPFVPIVNLRFYINSGGSDLSPSYGEDYNDAYNAGYNLVAGNLSLLHGIPQQFYKHFTNLDSLYPQTEHKLYVQFTNEQAYHPFDYAFYYGVGKALEKQGLRGMLFNDGVGHPEPDQMLHRSQQCVEDKPFFQWMIDNNHLYGLHCYADPNNQPGDANPYYSTRYKELFDPIPVHPQVVITETGQFTPKFVSPDAFVSDVKGYETVLEQTDYVLCANWWCYNTGGDPQWDAGNFSSALPQIETYVAS
jgi:hypothetical protein